MQLRRTLCLTAMVLALAAAAPAWAHEEISPSDVPIGEPAYLVLSASNEKTVDLNSLTITAPEGGDFGHATRDPAGWTSELTHTRIAWTGGAVKPGRFEQFGFDIGGFTQPGTVIYTVTLGFTDGSSADVEVPVNAASPDGGATTPVTVATTVAPTATTAPEAPGGSSGSGDTTESAAAEAGDTDDGNGLAVAAVAIAVVALTVSIVAAARGRRSPPGAPAAEAAGKGQDW